MRLAFNYALRGLTPAIFLLILLSLYPLALANTPNQNQTELQATSALPPTGLLCELIAHPDRAFIRGNITSIGIEDPNTLEKSQEYVRIRTAFPKLGWIVNDKNKNVKQSAYQILIASSLDNLSENIGDIWDSGKMLSDESINIQYNGTPLSPNKTYHWKVRTWNGTENPGPFSAPQSFRTGDITTDYTTTRYPLEKREISPVSVLKTADDTYYIDFGKAAFGSVKLTLTCEKENQQVEVHLGEVTIDNKAVNRDPGGSRRYRKMILNLIQGTHTYTVLITPDDRNTRKHAILMPSYTGEVMPFRYCELVGYTGDLDASMVKQLVVHYPFNDLAADFHSSNTILNDVWELCKYSMKATSFCGVYVDGDRERIPYEADAYINQLGHYCTDREFSMARYTHEYLMTHPTWPTEWILHSVLMAYADYKQTGDISSVKQFYTDLKAKTLSALARKDGLISTQTGLVTADVLKSIHFPDDTKLRDIVDWPHTGILGLNKGEGGETDGFEFKPINTVVNAFFYRTLVIMSEMATTLNKKEEAKQFAKQAVQVKKTFNSILLNTKKGYYVDGEGSNHSSLHANMTALAFDLVPKKYVKSVAEFIKSRRMACSVYGSQYLMESLYRAGEAEYALSLLTATHDRGWAHMIYDVGSTITLEAWDNKYKPNQDWNHAWGAAPANIIPRGLMGVTPLEPGFRKILIKPQPGSLANASLLLPTIRGSVKVEFDNQPEQSFSLNMDIPANTTARVVLPKPKKGKVQVMLDGKKVKAKIEKTVVVLDPVGSGQHTISIQ